MNVQIVGSIFLCFRLLNSAMNLEIEITAESVHEVFKQPPASLTRLLPEVFEKLRQPAKHTHRFMEVYTVRLTFCTQNKTQVIPLVYSNTTDYLSASLDGPL
jgi:hypothetical protein